MIKYVWNKIKKALGLDTVGTIVKARIKMISGLISAGVASVASFSFLPFLTDNINWMVLAGIAAYLFIDGVFDEVIRRWNAQDI